MVGAASSASNELGVVRERRAVLADVCIASAERVIALVVDEAARAANLLGFGRDATRRYGDAIMGTLPLASDAIREMDPGERARKIDALSAAVRRVSEQHRIPMLIERGLTSIAVRLACQAVRRGANGTAFTSDELEAEFVAFADDLEASLFRR